MGQLSIEYRPLSDLLAQRWVENPKDHDLGLIHQSIDEHGFNDPVTLGRVGKQEMLVEGHGRLECLEQKRAAGSPAPAHIRVNGKGWEVPVNIGVEFPTMQKAKKYALQHNRLTEMGGYMDDKLLSALKEQADDLDGIGWDDDDLHALGIGIEPPPEAPEAQIDRADELQKIWQTATGQLWTLGEHRLLCGDSTKRDDVEKVMGGDRAALIFTDPPYGVSQAKKNRALNEFENRRGGDSQRNLRDIEDDDLTPDELYKRLLPAFANFRKLVMADDCTVFSCAPQGGGLGMMMMMMMQEACLPVRHVLIWKKNSPTFSMGRLDYDYQHEPILLTWGKKHKRPMRGQYKTSVWEVDKPRSSKEHPTMKPIELPENAMLNNSETGDIVFDGYLGSGTTLLAAERQGRKCRAIEISPAYVAVALQRWADMTGKKPEMVK